MHFLVNGAKENLPKDLVGDIYKEEYFEALLQEEPTTAMKRKLCAEQLDALKQAKKIIQAAELREMAGML